MESFLHTTFFVCTILKLLNVEDFSYFSRSLTHPYTHTQLLAYLLKFRFRRDGDFEHEIFLALFAVRYEFERGQDEWKLVKFILLKCVCVAANARGLCRGD